MRRIYLDHNSTTPVDPSVVEAMRPYAEGDFGNPSSPHWAGRAAREAIEAARAQLARALCAKPSGVLFTSGGTEALNTAIFGVVSASGGKQPHLVCSAVEHPAVLEPCKRLEAAGRVALTLVPVDGYGSLDPDAVIDALRPETVLVAVMRANNEIGNLYDTQTIAGRLREKESQALLLVDAVQAAGKIPVDLESSGADLLAISGHKLYGPKGIGALVQRRATAAVAPQLVGGPQEGERRAGTENVAGIVGLGVACTLTHPSAKIAELASRLIDGLKSRTSGIVEHGDVENRLPGTLNLRFEGVDAEALLIELDLNGVAASSGSACASGSKSPSHVLLALGLSPEEVHQSIRFSLGRGSTQREIDALLELLPPIVTRLRS